MIVKLILKVKWLAILLVRGAGSVISSSEASADGSAIVGILGTDSEIIMFSVLWESFEELDGEEEESEAKEDSSGDSGRVAKDEVSSVESSKSMIAWLAGVEDCVEVVLSGL